MSDLHLQSLNEKEDEKKSAWHLDPHFLLLLDLVATNSWRKRTLLFCGGLSLCDRIGSKAKCAERPRYGKQCTKLLVALIPHLLQCMLLCSSPSSSLEANLFCQARNLAVECST